MIKWLAVAILVALGTYSATFAQNQAVDDSFRYTDAPAEYTTFFAVDPGTHDIAPNGNVFVVQATSNGASFYLRSPDGQQLSAPQFLSDEASNFAQPFVLLDGTTHIFFSSETSAGNFSLRRSELDAQHSVVTADTPVGASFENLTAIDNITRLSPSAFFIGVRTASGVSNGYVYELTGITRSIYSFAGTVDRVFVGNGQHVFVETDLGAGPIVRTYSYSGSLVEDRPLDGAQFVAFDGDIYSITISSTIESEQLIITARLFRANGEESDALRVGSYSRDPSGYYPSAGGSFGLCGPQSLLLRAGASYPGVPRLSPPSQQISYYSRAIIGGQFVAQNCIDIGRFQTQGIESTLITVDPERIQRSGNNLIIAKADRCIQVPGRPWECSINQLVDVAYYPQTVSEHRTQVSFDVVANDAFLGNTRPQIINIENVALDGVPIPYSPSQISIDGGKVVIAPVELGGVIVAGDEALLEFDYTTELVDVRSTAHVSIVILGENDSPVATNDNLTFSENDAHSSVLQHLLTNDFDPDAGETEMLAVTAVNTDGTLGQAVLTSTELTYSPNGVFDSLPAGQTGSDSFGYTISDPDGLTDTATVAVTINGENDAPVAANDAVTFSEEEGARNITFALLTNDTDVDTGETAQLAITAVDTAGTQGVVDLTNGQVHYIPNGAFNALSAGQTATDSFTYTISDPGGLTSTATVTVTINGFDGYTLTTTVEGLGTGTVSNLNLSINCGNGGSACSRNFEQGTSVELYATPGNGSRFDSWTGACTGSGSCIVPMTQAQSATARFELASPPDGRIVAATLPGARSGYVGGPDLTAYMTVVSRASTPAQDCRISARDGAPFTFNYRQLDGSNQPTGATDPRFDLANGGASGFVFVMTPSVATGASAYTFQPQIECDNAVLAPISGVNSILLSIGNAPVPDILSIGATVTGDGVVRIPSSGNRISFMSAAAMNIGAGDGSAGAGNATVTVSVDTGGAVLPVTLEICETNASGSCTTPRGQRSLGTVFSGSSVKTFAVFVRANDGATVPFDPAGSRVYLRFTDSTGTLRSVASAAISAPQ